MWLVLTAGVVGGAVACNETGTCPAKGAFAPDASCQDDGLQCAYDLVTPSAACDGTTTVIPSSCMCTSGAWVCPSAWSCDAGAADAADAAVDGGGG
jgi:hypothetical protein